MKILIVGAGGLARELGEWFAGIVDVAGFWTSTPDGASDLPPDVPRFSGDIAPADVGTSEAVIAIGSPQSKEAVQNRLTAMGFQFPSLVHPAADVTPSAHIGRGVVISPQCVVSSKVELGDFSYLNFMCGIGHDTVIGKYVQINPGVQVGGEVTVGDNTLLGSGATVLQGLAVGSGVTVASGSVCFTRVPDNVTVMGNPARRMRAFDSNQ